MTIFPIINPSNLMLRTTPQHQLLPWKQRLYRCAPLVCLLLTGCFNSESMIDARRKIAVLARLEEVDLGKFSLTLPQPSGSSQLTEIQFHAFGQVANRDLEEVTTAIEELGPELRHRLLMAIRQFDLSDLEESDLTKLKETITGVVNKMLPEASLHSVGLYSFAYHNF